jgi:hypothetical protein
MNEALPDASERSIGELLGDFSRELTTLVRQELTLAKAEVSQKASRLGRDAIAAAAGVALGYAGLLAILAGIILALAQAMPGWAAALLVGSVVAAAGAFLVIQSINHLRRADLAPRETIETLKEDATWIRERAR